MAPPPFICVFALLLAVSSALQEDSSDCRALYCQGDLLNDVQLSGIFHDSKTFVDKRLKRPPQDIIKDYETLKKNCSGSVPQEVLQQFIDANFEDGDELEVWMPHDWTGSPSVLERIADPELRTWAANLTQIWKHLSRRIVEDVKHNPDLYSLIYVPNGFVIPGGRFRELYYWDTYWIVNGLIRSDMINTAKGVIENLMKLVDKLGYVPNGNRVYYKGRSQPPMLVFMVNSYFMATGDFSIIKDNIRTLDKEMNFWLNNRSLLVNKNGFNHLLFHYDVQVDRPRPESYKEDVATAGTVPEGRRKELYKDLRSAAESGWDFSTRWFIKEGTNQGNLSDISARDIVPVDLNALLQKAFSLMSNMHRQMRNKPLEMHYKTLANRLLTSINTVLWNDEAGSWLDYDKKNKKSRDYLYLSNFVPLWTGSHTFSKEYITNRTLDYIYSHHLDQFIGGSPTSLEYSGEQWDYPNAWPPLQAFVIEGLDRIGSNCASALAFELAQKWIHANYQSYRDSGVMYEKYNSVKVGQTGGGGEYSPQEGFGWTNGFVFQLLYRWGDKLKR